MADITQCTGNNCPLKSKCWRYLAPQGMWQYYFTNLPYVELNGKCKCEYYWEHYLWDIEEGDDNGKKVKYKGTGRVRKTRKKC